MAYMDMDTVAIGVPEGLASELSSHAKFFVCLPYLY